MQSDQDQSRLALAALTACIVQALHEPQGDLRTRFVQLLERAYHKMRDHAVDNSKAMETLHWTKQILRELD